VTEARRRRTYIAGELAAFRVPELVIEPPPTPTPVEQALAAWADSRLDVAGSTKVAHRVAVGRISTAIKRTPVGELRPADVSAWIAELHDRGSSRSSIYKSLAALRMALDHYGLDPNPARDRRVKLPREVKREINPPTAAAVEAAVGATAPRYRLPLLLLEATGMRVGELEGLRWGAVDEPEGRWRVSRATSKTSRARFVSVPPDLFALVLARVPREDRDPEALVSSEVNQPQLRTALGRACKAAGVPAFRLHDLRHRRLSLWHHEGIPGAEAARRAGHSRPSITLDVYSQVLVDGAEIDRPALLDDAVS
jgi:integrase